jgi:putative peptidoglycan lipid II flippase
LLLVFLRRNPQIAVGRALRSALAYTFKLIIFSIIAVIPVLWLNPQLQTLFASRNRLISQGFPILINAIIFGAIGIALLVITKDKQVRAIIRMIRQK